MKNHVFGERLIELRTKNKLSQRDLADDTSIPQSSIAHWERRRQEPDLDKLITIADFFDVTTDYLLGRTDTY